jgi:hypothetical protein
MVEAPATAGRPRPIAEEDGDRCSRGGAVSPPSFLPHLPKCRHGAVAAPATRWGRASSPTMKRRTILPETLLSSETPNTTFRNKEQKKAHRGFGCRRAERCCADAVQPSSGGIREAGEALPRFGLDIGRGTSGWADGADAVRGHPRFLRKAQCRRAPRSCGATARGDTCRKRTVPSLHEHLMRDLAKWRRERRPARSRCGPETGTVHEIAHQAKPDGGVRGALGADGVPEKMRMAPCRASIRLPFPTSRGKRGAPPPRLTFGTR